MTIHNATHSAGDNSAPANPATPGKRHPDTEQGVRLDAREWLVRRDVDAVTAHLWPWLLAYDATTTDTHPAGDTAAAVQPPPPPLLGTPEWVAADDTTRAASIAGYVLACLAERDPMVLTARLAAEIAHSRALRLVAARQASHAISAAHDWAAQSRRPSHAEIRRRRTHTAPPQQHLRPDHPATDQETRSA